MKLKELIRIAQETEKQHGGEIEVVLIVYGDEYDLKRAWTEESGYYKKNFFFLSEEEEEKEEYEEED